jgi:hypothetical protein
VHLEGREKAEHHCPNTINATHLEVVPVKEASGLVRAQSHWGNFVGGGVRGRADDQ